MKVKIRCIECGRKHKIYVATLKEARRAKRSIRNNYTCEICKFRKLANNLARGIIQGIGY